MTLNIAIDYNFHLFGQQKAPIETIEAYIKLIYNIKFTNPANKQKSKALQWLHHFQQCI